ncbi:hypothetical protein [Microlunatus speluncae]|uniref:hypothetical protein n=1 Tax=Microlunatus speluncae TaxID=2594267 RepID=UPI00126681A2|nr:hypothetical protein [Microlunatus speluncae]
MSDVRVPDDRLAAATGASRAWYEMAYGLHGKGFRTVDGLWLGTDPGPPWHSGAMTLQPGLEPARVIELLGPDFDSSIADNFVDLDLADQGFTVLFDATWVHAPAPRTGAAHPEDWSVITSPELLAEWSRRHDYVGVLTEAALRLPELRILARTRDGRLTGGAVLHRTGSVVAVSNVWADVEPGGWAEIMIMAELLFPGRDLVGYERDQDLTDALAASFTPVGPHRVWLSS